MTIHEAARGPATPDDAARAVARPPFDVEIQREPDRAIVIPRGELDLATVDRLGAAIDALVDSGYRTVVLDLRRLTFMDSTGLRLILSQSGRPDVRLRLIDGAEEVTRLFELCRVRVRLSFMDPRELRRPQEPYVTT